jgi:uncharacterized Zn-finger protein
VWGLLRRTAGGLWRFRTLGLVTGEPRPCGGARALRPDIAFWPRRSTRRSNAEGADAFPLRGLTTRIGMTNEIIPHFHNDLGVPVIEIGAKKFMCMGALPPQDHPHVFCDMGEDVEYVCPYCSTLYRHNPALAPNQAHPAQCEFHDVF